LRVDVGEVQILSASLAQAALALTTIMPAERSVDRANRNEPSGLAVRSIRSTSRRRRRRMCLKWVSLAVDAKAFRIVFNALARLTYLAKLSKKSLRRTLTTFWARTMGALLWGRGAPVGIS
jgi:hypothetical protein